jgi:hypothetical protein
VVEVAQPELEVEAQPELVEVAQPELEVEVRVAEVLQRVTRYRQPRRPMVNQTSGIGKLVQTILG